MTFIWGDCHVSLFWDIFPFCRADFHEVGCKQLGRNLSICINHFLHASSSCAFLGDTPYNLLKSSALLLKPSFGCHVKDLGHEKQKLEVIKYTGSHVRFENNFYVILWIVFCVHQRSYSIGISNHLPSQSDLLNSSHLH